MAACTGGGEAGPSPGTSEPDEPAPPAVTETVEMREIDPAAWRIRAKTECTSMLVDYDALFREGAPPRPRVARESARVLRGWHAQMVELGALEADEALFEEAMRLYDEGIAGLEAGADVGEPFANANELVAGLGLDTCVEAVELVRSGNDPDSGEIVLLQDDFTRRELLRPDWTVSRKGQVAFAYVRGRYRVRVREPGDERLWYGRSGWAGGARRSVRVEVETRLSSGSPGFEALGVLCLTRRGAGYFFGVGPEERYATVQRLSGETFRPLYEDTSVARVRPRVNHVRGECRGGGKRPTRVRLFVNGKLTRVVRDRNGHDRYTGVGLAVFSPDGALEVLFDDVVATELRPARGR